jgi:hypothetical protein
VIELSSQAFVLSIGFRLVPFGVQIVAKAVGWRVFPFWISIRAESSDRKRPPGAKMIRLALAN